MKNTPALWINDFQWPSADGHKYDRGQVAILGGAEMTGAACLAAQAAARIGAGLVTIISPVQDFPQDRDACNPTLIYRAFRPHIIVRDDVRFLDILKIARDRSQVAGVIGVGAGLKHRGILKDIVMRCLRLKIPMVLDADGLSAFEDEPETLLSIVHDKCVLTPHEGEFLRIFPKLSDILACSRMEAVAAASEMISGVLVLKGKNTLIAKQGEAVVLNDNAPPFLATAGAGDVLSGIIAGLMAQGVDAFQAACAAVWIHGKAAENFGIGLVADDLSDEIPKVLQELLGIHGKVS